MTSGGAFDPTVVGDWQPQPRRCTLEEVTRTYEFSGVFMGGVTQALHSLKLFDTVMAGLSEPSRDVLRRPRSEKWWPGVLLAEVTQVVDGQAGAQAVERLAWLTAERTVAPMVKPLLRVALALAGSTPATIFSRASTFGSTAMRGVELAWNPNDDAAGGLLTAEYPEPVPSTFQALWRGTLLYACELTGASGMVDSITVAGKGTVLRIPVRWQRGGGNSEPELPRPG